MFLSLDFYGMHGVDVLAQEKKRLRQDNQQKATSSVRSHLDL
jgi:hypothetical protein